MRYLFGLVVFAAASVAWGAEIEVSVEGPTTVQSGGFALVGHGPEGAVLRWRVETPEGAASPLELVNSGGDPVLVFLATSPGRYGVVLTGQVPSDGLDPFGEASHPVMVGTLPPGPTPVPPGPTPPTPPEPPTPDVKPPFPAEGLSVLMVYDALTQNDIPAGQRAILFGQSVRDLLDSVADDYRIFPESTDVTEAEETWKAAMAVPRESEPWIVISNGKTGISTPLPANPEALADLLDQYKD